MSCGCPPLRLGGHRPQSRHASRRKCLCSHDFAAPQNTWRHLTAQNPYVPHEKCGVRVLAATACAAALAIRMIL